MNTNRVILSFPNSFWEREGSWTKDDRRKAAWALFKKLGMCRHCQRHVQAPSETFCRRHLAKRQAASLESSAARYARRKEEGLCVRCERMTREGRAYCPGCAEKARRRAEELRGGPQAPPKRRYRTPREKLDTWEAGLKERLSQGSHGAQKGTQEDLGKAALRDGWLSDGVAS